MTQAHIHINMLYIYTNIHIHKYNNFLVACYEIGYITVNELLWFYSHQPYIILGICRKKVSVSNILCKNDREKSWERRYMAMHVYSATNLFMT